MGEDKRSAGGPAGRLAPGRLGARLTGRLALLAASMRAAGARVGVDELLGAHRALAAVDPADRAAAYFALRAALCSRRDDLAAFDAAFAEWFSPRVEQPEPPAALDDVASLVLPRMAVPGEEARIPADVEADVVPAAWSDAELLRDKDFADYTDAERRLARRMMRRIAGVGPTRPSRRTRPARRRGAPPHAARPDLRRTIRSSLRTGGDPFERHWREPAERPRPLVLVCDVSGSMEPYARMLLQYMQACVAARRRVEAFVFGTRLTRVTRELGGRDPDRALDRAAGAADDWSGGTRIGEALAELNREHGRRLGRGAVVVLLSDGWDRGDPEQLAAEVARLQRCAHRLVWLNPLKAHPGYEPLTRGMSAALPHVDHFLAGNSLSSLEELADLMEGGFE
ncbi:MAG TPA: VWA domain-containing protein [Solirubrobacteraceae bacterium]|nr:VWA domain-containing protein [Solirubrobacteraceae bacterium]